MLAELKFVQGAVAKRDLLPAMTHFRIENGTVRSYNGRMALSSPIALDIDCCPKADAMFKAISNCEEAVTVTLTANGRLSIRSGAFKVLVPTIDGPTPHVEPAGARIDMNGEQLVKAFKMLQPFIGTDASRPFTTGILLHEGSAYATNNVCIVQYWLGAAFPGTASIPSDAIDEIVRIGEPPSFAQIDADSITFHYSDGRWIRTQLLTDRWPLENVLKVLDVPSNPTALPAEMFKGLTKLKSLAKALSNGSKSIYFKDGALRTSIDPDDDGATYELGVQFEGSYNVEMLSLLEGVVTSADMSLYPNPCLFFGENLRGAIIGMRS